MSQLVFLCIRHLREFFFRISHSLCQKLISKQLAMKTYEILRKSKLRKVSKGEVTDSGNLSVLTIELILPIVQSFEQARSDLSLLELEF